MTVIDRSDRTYFPIGMIPNVRFARDGYVEIEVPVFDDKLKSLPGHQNHDGYERVMFQYAGNNWQPIEVPFRFSTSDTAFGGRYDRYWVRIHASQFNPQALLDHGFAITVLPANGGAVHYQGFADNWRTVRR